MENRGTGRSHIRKRTKGSITAEAAAITCAFVGIALPIFTFFINVGFQLLYQNRLTSAASNIAIYASQQGTWLGLPRPNRLSKIEDINEVAAAMCSKLGARNASAQVTIKPGQNAEIYICDLTANVLVPFRFCVLGFDVGRFLPGAVTVRGVAAAPITQPYATVKFDGQAVQDSNPNRAFENRERCVAFLPCYGFTRGGETTQWRNLGLPPRDSFVADNTLAINSWPFDRTTFQDLGVKFKPGTDLNDGRQLIQVYFHPDMGSGGTNY